MDEMTCPECGNRMRYNFEHSMIMCPNCGYAPLHAKNEEIARQKTTRKHARITHRGELKISARTAYHTAYDFLNKGDTEKAREHLHRAIRFQPDFTDAHLTLADIAEDEETKREHLSAIIAFDPGNGDALRRLMVLNGRLSEDEMAQTYHHDDQAVEHVDAVVAEKMESLLCPVCGGALTVDEENGQVRCKFCGYVALYEPSRRVGVDSLAMALIERKVKPVRWVVGKRILHCNECGAERTIPARKLTHQCPFCGSQQVIQQDAVESLQQPDGLIQFKVGRTEAREAIINKLDGVRHRIANLFDNNRVAGGVLQAVYMPFWVYDALVDVSVTRKPVQSRNNDGILGRSFATYSQPITETFTDAMSNVAICGVTPPALELTQRLGDYDFEAMVSYESKLLAKHPAELYNIDFDKASLEARSTVSKFMREKHSVSYDSREEISVFPNVKHMDFRLLLLPVWVASLMEEDGDVRPALVNGQTGSVALGKAEKRR